MDGTTGSRRERPASHVGQKASKTVDRLGGNERRARATDDAADRHSYAIVAALVCLSLLVEATSLILDGDRDLSPFGWWTPFILEGSSHAMLVVLFPLVPAILDRAPLTAHTWQWALPLHVAGFLAFSLAHVAAFVAIRTLAFSALGESYVFGISNPLVWLYELRKDAFTYALFVVLVALNRAAHYRRLERAVATDDARDGGRITLKCGGRTLHLRSAEVDAVSAAGNYVEVACGPRRYLARTTLSALEALLRAAGSHHVRVHRSHIVNVDAIREVLPAGTGEATVRLSSGFEVPVSRRYRDTLAEALRRSAAKGHDV
ncbi:MAG: LytTR family DNA-binding domain-containing protein [Pseudomonadota bacterium]